MVIDFKKELSTQMKKNSGYLVPNNKDLYKKVISEMIKPFKNNKITKVVAPEMKGMMYGPTIAYKLGLPFVSILKGERIQKKYVISKKYRDYSKKIKYLDIGKKTIKKRDKILIVDDVFESGETGKAAIKLIEKLGGRVGGISVIYNKLNKKEENFFKAYNFHYLIKLK